MVGASDSVWAAVVLGGLAFAGVLVTAILTRAARKSSREIANEILGQMHTGNDHSLGQSVARLEDMAWRHEGRLDATEVLARETHELAGEIATKLDDHLASTAPIVAEFQALKERLAEGGDHV